jgi:protein SCO1/2
VAHNPAQTTWSLPGTSASGDGPQPLQEGDRLPADLTLVDQNGDPIRMEAFRGQALVLTFIYTSCPLQEYCPLMSKRFATLQPTLRDRFGRQVHLFSISFDPATNTPGVLRDYAAEYTDRLDTWTFATGDTSQVTQATRLFQVYTELEQGEITHNLVTAVVAPNGTVQRLFRGNEWTPEDVTQAVGRVLYRMCTRSARAQPGRRHRACVYWIGGATCRFDRKDRRSSLRDSYRHSRLSGQASPANERSPSSAP